MRRLSALLLLPILVAPCLADEPPKPHAARMTWEQHFTQANAAHDGHLTLQEAKAAYPMVAKHFDDMDADHKGYVTENDIRAWRIMRRASHRLASPPPNKPKAQPVSWLHDPNRPASPITEPPMAGK